MRIPARAARGIYMESGANNKTIAATAITENTPDHCVKAPACWLIADLVSEPEPGKQ